MHKTKPLTQAQVDSLPTGTRIRVIWSGGNGPHEYLTERDRDGTVLVNNVYHDALKFVGERPLTQVFLC